MRTILVAALLAACTGSPALAYDPIVVARGWERVDAFETDECAGEVGTNGQFYVISVTGLAPGEPAFLTITNGDMTPIEREVRADGFGEWQEYYIPFRYNRGEGDFVTVTLAGETCVVPLGFAWRRAKGWDEPGSLIPR
jgi:hypothetical protein